MLPGQLLSYTEILPEVLVKIKLVILLFIEARQMSLGQMLPLKMSPGQMPHGQLLSPVTIYQV